MKRTPLRRKLTALLLALALCLSLAACGQTAAMKDDTAAVQSVAMLVGLDLTGNNRYTGVTEAKSTQKVMKDESKTVAECLVEVGQEVKKGDVLFTYDTEALKLSLETAALEVEQLQNSINSYASQIAELEKERKSAGSSEKLSYTLQIQETQLDKAEAEYNLKQKQAEYEKMKSSTENTEVKAEVSGVIQSISDSGSSDGYSDYSGGGDDAYITIMETGTYRIKGTISEANVYSIYEEMPVTVQSRTDASKVWLGTISEIDTGSTAQEDNNQNYYGDEAAGESASKYSFYVTLEDSEGLMMGQHVYIYGTALPAAQGISLSAQFIVDADSAPYVWASSTRGTLEKRSVTLGDYDELTDTYVITDGLTLDDYIASPEDSLTEGQAVVKYDAESYGFSEGSEEIFPEGDMSWSEGDMPMDEGMMEEGFAEDEGMLMDADEPVMDGTEEGELMDGAAFEGDDSPLEG